MNFPLPPDDPDPRPDDNDDDIPGSEGEPDSHLEPTEGSAPDPEPPPDYKTLLLELLGDAQHEMEQEGRHIESLCRIADQFVDRLKLLDVRSMPLELRRVVMRFKRGLEEFTEIAHRGEGCSDKSLELVFRVISHLEEMDVVPPKGMRGTSGLILELNSVSVKRRFDETGRPRSRWDVFFNDAKVTMPWKLAKLVEALASPVGSSHDQYVSYKSKDELQLMLGLSTSALVGGVCRLRRLLRKESRLSARFVQTNPDDGSYRLAVRRDGGRFVAGM